MCVLLSGLLALRITQLSMSLPVEASCGRAITLSTGYLDTGRKETMFLYAEMLAAISKPAMSILLPWLLQALYQPRWMGPLSY